MYRQNAANLPVANNAVLNIRATKLHRPSTGGDLVHRARLVDLLAKGRDLPLTLVSAPAGSGKTTLLSDWLATCPCPSAWLSLDEGDSDLAVFLSYFIVAIRTIVPNACEQTLALLQASPLPPMHVLAGLLSNEIEALRDQEALCAEKSFVLVLDDYHLVTGQAVNALLIEILRHPPQTLRLVLATRSDPALPLASLRGRGQVAEIRIHDLLFTREETRTYLQQTVNQPLTEEAVSTLVEKTEGWITGLFLTVLNLRQVADSSELVARIAARDRYAMDYLLDEVLDRQPQPIQDFLLKTSVLDRLCGSLCEAVAGSSEAGEGQTVLEQIERANLFLVALDDQQQWYRYHHLFQQLLRSRLERQAGPAQIMALHRRAYAWYAGNGVVEDAIAHALAGGDEEAVVQVIEAHRHDAINQERWQQLELWLRLVPRRLIDRQPELLLLEVWILMKQWRIADTPPYLARIAALLDASPSPEPVVSTWRAEVDALGSAASYYALDGERAHLLAGRALQALPVTYSAARGLAWMYYGAGLQAMGDMRSAFKVLQDALKENSLHRGEVPSRELLALCVISWMSGDLVRLNQTATHFLKLAEERDRLESIGWARYCRGAAAYQSNDLAAAESDFAAVVALRYIANGQPFSQSAFGLASIKLAQGLGEQARTLADSVVDYGLEMSNIRVLNDGRAFQARMALKQGYRAEAHRWAEGVDRTALLVPMVTFHVSAVTLAQVLLDIGTPSSLQEAGALLARLHSLAEKQCNTRVAIDILALQALLHEAQGDEPAALRSIQQAVTLAEPGGIIRAFVDLGPGIARLLARLNSHNGAGDWTARVLAAFPADDLAGIDGARPQPAPAQRASLVEPLTDRELEVLDLLARRLSAKEIAQRLVISDRTVKRHTANIYQKLGVNNRREAVATGAALGLLAAPP